MSTRLRKRLRRARPGFASSPKLLAELAYSASSGSVSRPGMTYLPDSQRFRSTSRQRGEQNGAVAGFAGLPHSGQGFDPPFDSPASLGLPAAWGGLAGIEPAEADRKALAAQQRDRFVERQADDIGVGADHLDHERSGDALHGVAAGFAAPFAGADIGLDVLLA